MRHDDDDNDNNDDNDDNDDGNDDGDDDDNDDNDDDDNVDDRHHQPQYGNYPAPASRPSFVRNGCRFPGQHPLCALMYANKIDAAIWGRLFCLLTRAFAFTAHGTGAIMKPLPPRPTEGLPPLSAGLSLGPLSW